MPDESKTDKKPGFNPVQAGRVMKKLFWIVFVLTLIDYAVMFFWSLPALNQMSGGLALFDLSPSGYNIEQALALLSALGVGGRAFYLNVQQPLDLLFPALLGLTLLLAIILLTPARFGWWRYLLCFVAVPGVVFDYMENAAVRLMLLSGPTDLSPVMVADAAGRTVAKFLLYSTAIALVLILLGLWVYRKPRAQQAG